MAERRLPIPCDLSFLSVNWALSLLVSDPCVLHVHPSIALRAKDIAKDHPNMVVAEHPEYNEHYWRIEMGDDSVVSDW